MKGRDHLEDLDIDGTTARAILLELVCSVVKSGVSAENHSSLA